MSSSRIIALGVDVASDPEWAVVGSTDDLRTVFLAPEGASPPAPLTAASSSVETPLGYVTYDLAELLYGPELARHVDPQAWARHDAWRLGRPVTRDRRVHVPDPARPTRAALDASFPPCVPTDGASWTP
ncbi:hypothetical protein ACFCZ3_19975 [Cellulosimicrobium cellulans]|uniref:hypothetical protein n=1 Tax=Cellulosimicrobium cellulans TaxID=1710 RepID=UPI0035DB0A8E